MPLNPVLLAEDLKSQFSQSSDPALKALTDAFYDKLAICIDTHIKRGTVVGVAVNTGTGAQTNIAPIV